MYNISLLIKANQILKMASAETFHPDALIVNHFARVINRLNSYVESELPTIKSSRQNEEINDLKNEIIKCVKDIEEFNLSHLAKNEDSIRTIWTNLHEKHEINERWEIIKDYVIKKDCYLLKDRYSKVGFSLIVTDWYTNKAHVQFLEYDFDILKYFFRLKKI